MRRAMPRQQPTMMPTVSGGRSRRAIRAIMAIDAFCFVVRSLLLSDCNELRECGRLVAGGLLSLRQLMLVQSLKSSSDVPVMCLSPRFQTRYVVL